MEKPAQITKRIFSLSRGSLKYLRHYCIIGKPLHDVLLNTLGARWVRMRGIYIKYSCKSYRILLNA